MSSRWVEPCKLTQCNSEETPKIDHLDAVEQADGLKEDQTVQLTVLAHYQIALRQVWADKVAFSTKVRKLPL